MKTGRNWTKEDILAPVMRVTYESALAEEEIAHFAAEAKEKVASNQGRPICYENFKVDLPTKMNVSSIVAISHK